MKYAVVKVAGKQYKVAPGDNLKIDAHLGEENKKIEFSDLLLLVDEKKVKIGQPSVSGKVVGTVLTHSRGPKVRIQTYKAKTGQHRSAGHRQDQTMIKIDEIEG